MVKIAVLRTYGKKIVVADFGIVKKTVKNGRLYLGDVEVGQVLEVAL